MTSRPERNAEPAISPETLNLPSSGQYRVRGFAFLAACLLLAGVVYLTPFMPLIADWQDWVAYFREESLTSGLSFMMIATVLITIGTPRLIFYTLAGLVFGFWLGLFWSVTACMAGSLLAFSIARWGLRNFFRHLFGHRKLCRKLTDATPSIMLVAVLRLLPVSNLLINISLALSRIRWTSFLAGSMIGYLPQGVLAVLAGESMAEKSFYAGHLQIFGIVLLLWLLPLISRKYLLKKRQQAL